MATTVSADSAKRALLERLIDDASLFPPSSLAMIPALRAHRRHEESAYWWVSGRFVVSASRLQEFETFRDPEVPIELSVILDAGAAGAKGDVIRADLARIDHAGELANVTIGSVEAKLPGAALDAAGIGRIAALIGERWPSTDIAFWYETSYDAGWKTPPDTWLAALAEARASAPAHVTLGAKVRCGGAAGRTPSVADLAQFLIAAHAHDVPWKATAGLHHPYRGMHGVEGGAVPHGFVNLFVAGIALHAGALDAARVGDVLAEEDPRAFVVDPVHVSWRDVRVEAEAVAAARERCVAFGSCSFDEPVNDLRELGIIA
ncbi:MAG: hypothetical protein NVS3B7_10950 [Candidatus Elarobacter sp.]